MTERTPNPPSAEGKCNHGEGARSVLGHCRACDFERAERFATVVIDPPWQYGKFNSFSSTRNALRGTLTQGTKALDYATMSVEEIAALPVGDLAADAAHLYLWTTQKYLWDAPEIVKGWGFKPSAVLTWCKPPMGAALGYAFSPTTEFVIFAHRGGLLPNVKHGSTWFAAPRPYERGPKHSAKPESFLDLVERVSPAPRLEMFARRNRMGWSAWGNECISDVEVTA